MAGTISRKALEMLREKGSVKARVTQKPTKKEKIKLSGDLMLT